MASKIQKYTLIRVDWVESERGWGTRPDGYSLHLTNEDYDAYERAYWSKQPEQVPDIYSRPYGQHKTVTIELTKKQYDQLVKEKGLRF